jgi:hypothetical protein
MGEGCVCVEGGGRAGSDVEAGVEKDNVLKKVLRTFRL